MKLLHLQARTHEGRHARSQAREALPKAFAYFYAGRCAQRQHSALKHEKLSHCHFPSLVTAGNCQLPFEFWLFYFFCFLFSGVALADWLAKLTGWQSGRVTKARACHALVALLYRPPATHTHPSARTTHWAPWHTRSFYSALRFGFRSCGVCDCRLSTVDCRMAIALALAVAVWLWPCLNACIKCNNSLVFPGNLKQRVVRRCCPVPSLTYTTAGDAATVKSVTEFWIWALLKSTLLCA